MIIWWSLDAKNTWFQAYVTHLWNWPFHLPHPHKNPCWDRLARLWQWQQVKTVSYMTREHTRTIKLKSPGGCNENVQFWFGPTDYIYISKLKIRSEKYFCLLLPNITIWNLEYKPKVCHSQNTAVAYRYRIIGISHTCFAISSGEIPWLFSSIFHNFSMTFHDKMFSWLWEPWN